MLYVSNIAKELGINPQTIYFYERIGLIPSPQRSKGGYRIFTEADRERLSFIIGLKQLGLKLDEIKQILEMKEGKILTCFKVYNFLQKKIIQTQQKISQLKAIEEELTSLLALCTQRIECRSKKPQCTIFDELCQDSNQVNISSSQATRK